MSVSAAPATTEANLEITESIYEFLQELFLKGVMSIPVSERSLDVLETLNCKSVTAEEEFIRFTPKGMNEFRTEYARRINAGLLEENTLQYFGCMYSERTGDGFDGPAIIGSSASILQYVHFLKVEDHLTLSDRTSECDYVVLEFLDVETGDVHTLFPGDVVVLNGEGYTFHKFSE